MSTVTVVIPTFNRASLLERALKSVLSQSRAVHEIIVVDDASTDNTSTLVESYAKEYAHIKYVRLEENRGAQHARNVGLRKSTGNWVSFLDSDNTYQPEMVEKLMNLAESNLHLDVVTCFSTVLNQENAKFRVFEWKTRGNIFSDILCQRMYVDYSSAIIKKSRLMEIGLLDENCPSFQEWDTFIALSKNCEFDFVPEELTNYYWHDGDRISNSPIRSFKGRYYLLKKYKSEIKRECTQNDYENLLNKAYDLIGGLDAVKDRTKGKFKFLMLEPRYVFRRIFESLTRRL